MGEIYNKTILRPLSGLKFHPSNPRIHSEDSTKRLAASIQEDPAYFEAHPSLLSDRTGELIIIGGEGRCRAARYLHMEKAPTYLFQGLTEEDEVRIMQKDNSHTGKWNDAKLAEMAGRWGENKMKSWSPDVKWKAKGILVKEDDFNEKPEPKCKNGEIWSLGKHRLMCGDSTDFASIDRLMNGIRADMVFTDPPYGVSIGDKNKMLNSFQKSGRIVENIENDTLRVSDLYDMLKAAMTNVRLHCKEDASYFVTAPQGGGLGLMMMMMKDAGLEVRHNLIWRKNTPTFSLGRLDYDYQHEPIMYTWTKTHHNYRVGQFRSTIWDFDKPKKCDLHPTMKPVALVVNCLLDCTKETDVVLDAFGGSGTTIIAAEQTGRICYMMELDPHYCDVIINRWEKFTGKKAMKING